MRLYALVRDGIRDDVPAEVDQLRVGDCLFQNLSLEDVDAHRGEVSGRVPGDFGNQGRQSLARRLLIEKHDAAGSVDLENAKSAGVLLRHGNHRHRRIGAALAMGAQHFAEVHAVQLVSGKHHQIARRSPVHVAQTLAHGIGRPLKPVASLLGLLRGQHGHVAGRKHVELVGPRDMGVQAFRVELGEHEDVAQPCVQTVADRDVNQAILPANRDGRLRALESEGKQARPTPAP